MPRKKTKIVPQVSVATRITVPTYDAMNDFLQRNAHVSPADYIRDLIRADLKREGYKLQIKRKKKDAK